jgi:hypothetical protein
MSSILEALERASQDRSSTEPELIPNGYVDLPGKGGRWLWFVLGIAMALLSLFGGWLYTAPPSVVPIESEVIESKAVTKSPEPARQQSIVASRPLKFTDLESQLLGKGVSSQHSLLAEVALNNSSKSQQIGRSKLASADMVSASADSLEHSQVKATLPAGLRIEPVSAKEAEGEVISKAVIPDKQRFSRQHQRSGSSPLAISEGMVGMTGKIPLIWELPQALREELAQLKISVHVYHEESRRRFVIVNMRRYKEGDKLTVKGYRLKLISREGIVVDYGDGLVRLLRE